MALAQGRVLGGTQADDGFYERAISSGSPVLLCDAEGYVLTRSRPVQITDEMVDRAVRTFGCGSSYRDAMRRALQAALS